MNRIIFLILIILSTSPSLGDHWVQIASGTSQTLHSVYFKNTQVGYIAGDGGTILKSTNGGLTWVKLNSGTTRKLLSVYFITETTGYVAGEKGTFLKTVNGGDTWTSLFSDTTVHFRQVVIPDYYFGYVTGSSSTLLRTEDGGNAWTNASPCNNCELNYISFPDVSVGYVSGFSPPPGLGGFLYKTSDAGLNWYIVNPDFHSDFPFFFSTTQLGCSLNEYRINRTEDGGQTWNTNYYAMQGYLTSIHFPNASVGYAVGSEETIHKTSDGGSTWGMQNWGFIWAYAFHAVYFPDPLLGFAVGEYGIIYRTTDGGGPVGTQEFSSPQIDTRVSYHPTEGTLTVETNGAPYRAIVSVLNIRGQELLRTEMIEKRISLDIRSFPAGVYLVSVLTGKGIETTKFLKNFR